MQLTGLALLLAATASPLTVAQGPPPASVRVDAARIESVQEQRLVTGELRAVRRARVATEEPGLVSSIPVQAGSRVKAGDVLAQLDSRRIEIELNRLMAEEAAASAALNERDADLQWRLRDLENLQTLAKGGASNPKELYDAESQVSIARAKTKAAEFAIAVITGNLELMKQRVADTRITAPFDGVVVTKLVEQGEWVAEGAAVVDMLAVSPVEVWLDVPQQFADAILGTTPTVTVNIEATGARIETADLRAVPSVDSKARTFPVVVRLDNSNGTLAPGMSVTAWVPTGDRAERLTVHKDAVMTGPTGAFAYAARTTDPNAPAVAMPMDVQVLFSARDRFVVQSSALSPGDLLIVEGNERLFPTAPVIPQLREAAAQTCGVEVQQAPERPKASVNGS
jgi:RND family efflux transporter MFP subunit